MPSSLSALNYRVEVLELDAGIVGGEPPVHTTTSSVAGRLPRGDLPLQVARSASRRSRHCPASTASSISAMVNQLPCLGVECSSSRPASRLASAGSNASYSDAGVWMFGVVLHQHNHLSIRVVDVDQVLDGSVPSR